MSPLDSDTAGRPRIRTTVGVPVGRVPRLSPEARAAVRLIDRDAELRRRVA